MYAAQRPARPTRMRDDAASPAFAPSALPNWSGQRTCGVRDDVRQAPTLQQGGLGIVAGPAREPDRRLDDEVRSARIRGAHQAPGQETEARLMPRGAMVMDGGERSLGDENRELGVLPGCGID